MTTKLIRELRELFAHIERETYNEDGNMFERIHAKALRGIEAIDAYLREQERGEERKCLRCGDYYRGHCARCAIEAPTASAPADEPVAKVVETAPPRIWLQVCDCDDCRQQPFPSDHEGITWCQDSIGGAQVEYVRADLRPQPPIPPTSGEPPEEVAARAWNAMCGELNVATACLVWNFALALANKLREAELKYGYSDGWRTNDWMDECRRHLVEHVAKGDPRDVAAYCAFLWYHGERTALPPTSGAVSDEDAVRLLELLPTDQTLDAVDDDLYSGTRPCPLNNMTIHHVRRLRRLLEWNRRTASQPAGAVSGDVRQVVADLREHWLDDVEIRVAADMLERLAASPAQAVSVPDGWKPIETAPNDETLFIAYWPAYELDEDGERTDVWTGDGYIGVTRSYGRCSFLEPDALNAVGDAFDDDFGYGPPTHWMPLPTAPSPPQHDKGSA